MLLTAAAVVVGASVEEVGSEVKSVKPGQFVIGSFFASDNTCPTCQTGYQSSCQHRELVGGAPG
jgi:Zn-dependent alcohol dehydrogenase